MSADIQFSTRERAAFAAVVLLALLGSAYLIAEAIQREHADNAYMAMHNCRPATIKPHEVVYECDNGLQFKRPTPEAKQ